LDKRNSAGINGFYNRVFFNPITIFNSCIVGGVMMATNIQSVSIPTALFVIAKRYKISISQAAQEGILLMLHHYPEFPRDAIEEEYLGRGMHAAFKKNIANSLLHKREVDNT